MHEAPVLFDGVWKKFQLGERHDSLRDLIPAWVARLAGRAPQSDELGRREFWALRDISFEVRPGETLGIIGRNGAGKSTVLKLLTKILKPTLGRCALQGRVGALIELAAGFHPDLTGRENIYLQGCIMGMRRAEIAQAFDAIVAFSGLATFVDTPVKRYSSGMHARLGFAIAAHLRPDVLIIDEVLAVGDYAFQAKAFDRLREVARQGIPVVVVSHQLDRIASLCSKAILLDGGTVVRTGRPEECIADYINLALGETGEGDGPVRLDSLVLRGPAEVRSGSWITLAATGSVTGDCSAVEPFNVRVRSMQTGQVLFATSNGRFGVNLPQRGHFHLTIELQLNVSPGLYAIESLVWDRHAERDVLLGPSVTLRVLEGAAFWGTVQMNPRMRLDGPIPATRTSSDRELAKAESGSD